ncbi:carboxymuconolactone decarboxylase family protein [Streptantibioticus ferralitis]|uniref:Carboxymuconolactone decarboxylase family protein n=1 Tax=Streptantibioticus ferralitis TaxID=236510 RepID=A0ABT5ZBA8_9ACTN|nr:carboxymuconolactone decarboxylase family protein [Streptantibioticus ferralitis]MDF2261109.1 carboxymuconolactone decarboxylase family protein [Streptantibioticus ferralitis]
MRPRIDPQDVDEFAVTPAGQAYARMAKEALNGLLADRPPPNVQRTIANHPTLLPAIQPLIAHVAGEVLPARERELVILRTAWRSQAPYVWAHHHAAGLLVGLSETEIARVASEDTSEWTLFEAALLVAVDELHTRSVISDSTWKQLAERYAEEEFLELLALTGTYKTLAFILNSSVAPIDPWLERPAVLPADPGQMTSGRHARPQGSRPPTPRTEAWNRRIVLQNGAGLSLLTPTTAHPEPPLHEILVRYPDLLSTAANAHDAGSRLLLIRRNPADIMPDTDGYTFSATHLFADSKGVPTVVEVVEPHDTWNANDALGKTLDYAGSGARHWPLHILQRSLEYTAQLYSSTGEHLLMEMGYSLDESSFLRTLEANLAVGRLRMVIVASKFPPEFNRVIEFLGQQLYPAEVYGVELCRYSDGAHAAYVPTVVG